MQKQVQWINLFWNQAIHKHEIKHKHNNFKWWKLQSYSSGIRPSIPLSVVRFNWCHQEVWVEWRELNSAAVMVIHTILHCTLNSLRLCIKQTLWSQACSTEGCPEMAKFTMGNSVMFLRKTKNGTNDKSKWFHISPIYAEYNHLGGILRKINVLRKISMNF